MVKPDKKDTCYHYPKLIYKLGGEVWAGQRSACTGYYSDFDLVLNCTGTELVFPQHHIPFEWGKEFENLDYTEQIFLDWYNMKPLCIKPGFWKALYKHLLDKKPKMLVMCEGSHGRTGTALAALLIASGMEKWNAVEKVRKLHCHKCVETQGQMDYLQHLEESLKELK